RNHPGVMYTPHLEIRVFPGPEQSGREEYGDARSRDESVRAPFPFPCLSQGLFSAPLIVSHSSSLPVRIFDLDRFRNRAARMKCQEARPIARPPPQPLV